MLQNDTIVLGVCVFYSISTCAHLLISALHIRSNRFHHAMLAIRLEDGGGRRAAKAAGVPHGAIDDVPNVEERQLPRLVERHREGLRRQHQLLQVPKQSVTQYEAPRDCVLTFTQLLCSTTSSALSLCRARCAASSQ